MQFGPIQKQTVNFCAHEWIYSIQTTRIIIADITYIMSVYLIIFRIQPVHYQFIYSKDINFQFFYFSYNIVRFTALKRLNFLIFYSIFYIIIFLTFRLEILSILSIERMIEDRYTYVFWNLFLLYLKAKVRDLIINWKRIVPTFIIYWKGP